MKNFLYAAFVIICTSFQHVSAVQGKKPVINCEGLPGCSSDGKQDAIEGVAANIISQLILYVAVFAVIALMISGVMYMLSSGEEEKTKKAKTWIIWSVLAVVISISAYFIVNTLNEINIT